MNHKKLLIAIIAIVLVAAVLLTVYFVCRKDRKLSELSDRELIKLLDDSGVFIPEGFDTPMIRKMIDNLESLSGDESFNRFISPYNAPDTIAFYTELWELTKQHNETK